MTLYSAALTKPCPRRSDPDRIDALASPRGSAETQLLARKPTVPGYPASAVFASYHLRARLSWSCTPAVPDTPRFGGERRTRPRAIFLPASGLPGIGRNRRKGKRIALANDRLACYSARGAGEKSDSTGRGPPYTLKLPPRDTGVSVFQSFTTHVAFRWKKWKRLGPIARRDNAARFSVYQGFRGVSVGCCMWDFEGASKLTLGLSLRVTEAVPLVIPVGVSTVV